MEHGLNRLQTLGQFYQPGLRLGGGNLGSQTLAFLFKVHILEHLAERFSPHANAKFLSIFLKCFHIFVFGHDLVLIQWRQTGVQNYIGLEIEDPFQFLESLIEQKADTRGKAF